jgi:hypothetical protein
MCIERHQQVERFLVFLVRVEADTYVLGDTIMVSDFWWALGIKDGEVGCSTLGGTDERDPDTRDIQRCKPVTNTTQEQ